jgi:hypothetical protein
MLQLFAPRETDSTSDVLGHDWSEVASELSGHSKHQYKEPYRLADTVAELKFVFIRVIFLRSPSSRSSLVLTKVTDSADSTRPIHYSTYERRVASAPAFSPRYSHTHAHRCIGPRSATSPSNTSARLMYLSVSHSTGPPTPYPLPSPLDTTFPCST